MRPSVLVLLALPFAASLAAGSDPPGAEVIAVVPQPLPPAAVVKPRAVLIRSVRDDRALDPADEALRPRLLGRRHTPQASVPLLLPQGTSVAAVVRDNLEEAFRQAGYRVAADAGSAGPEPLVVDVQVNEFLATIVSRAGSVQLQARMHTGVQVAGGPSSAISVGLAEGRSPGAAAAGDALLHRVLAQHRAQATARFSAPPF